ncbi:unnamed protein product [Closterium sp. Naga37s-1]|nr:unnamed protein product [Closterium sp. Naga37s-1]
MSYAAYKVVHPPTGVTCCASGFLTRSAAAEPLPNLIVSRGNVLQVFSVRSEGLRGDAEAGERKGESGKDGGSHKDAGSSVLPGATLDVVCEFRWEYIQEYPRRLNGVVESIAVVPGAAAADAAGWAGTGGGGSNSVGGGGRGVGRGAAGGEAGGRGGRGRGGRQSGKREGRDGGGGGITGDMNPLQGATVSGIGNNSSGSGGRKDALVLTFRDAKVSVVEFDDAVQRLKVSSLHYLEGPEWTARKRGRENFPLPPIARSDWSGRCSAVLVYRCHLHFLTRKQPGHTQTGHIHPGNTETGPDTIMSPTAQRSASFNKSGSDRTSLDQNSSFKGGLDRSSSFRAGSTGEAPRFGGSFTIDLRPLGISNVRDFVFLSEPGDPIVAVLWEEGSAWAGRLGGSSPAVLGARFSCAVTFLRVSLHTRSHLILGTTKACSSSLPTPSTSAPRGILSLLVLSPHSLHFCSSSSTCHLALNDSSPPALPDGTEIPRPRQQPGQAPLSVELEAAHATWQPVIGPSGGPVGVGGSSSSGGGSSSSSAVAFLASKGGALVVVKVTPEAKPTEPSSCPAYLFPTHFTAPPPPQPNPIPQGDYLPLGPAVKQVRATVQAGSYQATTFRLDLLQVRATVQASGILSLGPNLLFVASRLGDSMLIRYRANEHGLEKQRGAKRLKADEASDGEGTAAAVPAAPADAAAGAEEEEEQGQEGFSFREKQRGAKRLKADEASDGDGTAAAAADAAVTGAGVEEEEQGQEGFSFRVCDSLLNIGPIRDLVPVPAFPAPTPQKEQQQQQQQMLVACSGHGKNGALSVLLQRVPLDVLTQEDLPGCCGLWTVYGSELPSEAREGGEDGQAAAGQAGGTAVEGEGAGKGGIGGVEGGEEGCGAGAMEVEGGSGVGGGEGGKGDRGGSYHGFLVLAFEGQSMVLETGELLREVLETGELLREVSAEVSFITNAPTLLAANLFSLLAHPPLLHPSSAQVLETGELLREVSAEVSFITDAPTLLAANLFSRRCILQVTPSAVRLLASSASLLQEMLPRGMVAGAGEGGGEGMEEGNEGGEDVEIESADVADPYVMLRLVDGRFILLGPGNALVGKKGPGKTGVKGDEEMVLKEEGTDGEGKEEGKNEGREEGKEVDVEMDGGSGAGIGGVQGEGLKAEEGKVKEEVKESVASQKTEFDGAERAMTVHTPAPVATSAHMSAPDWPKQFVVDLHVSVNPVTGRLFLFVVLSDGRLLGFRAFCPSGASPADVIAASVSVTGERGARAGGRAGGGGGQGVGEGEPGGRVGSIGAEMADAAARQSVGAPRESIFEAPKEHTYHICPPAQTQATEAASSVVAMAPFHNVNCTHGFLLISSLGVLSICQLPPLFQFDNAWPLNKIPLRSTPHSVTLSPDAAHLFLVTSTPVSRPVSQFLVPSLEDPKDPSTAALGSAGPGGPGAPGSSGTDAEAVAMVEDFQLRVLTCPSLEAPSRALEVRQSFEFQPFEAVTMVKSVVLRNRSSGQLQTLLAVCTTFITGEDAPGKGRILLFEYNPLATADGGGGADGAGAGAAATADAEGKAAGGSIGIPLLRELYSKEPIAGSSQRGSVAALTALQGNLLLAVGRQLVLYAWNGVELEGIAFLDAPLYVVSMATVKSFVIVGDVLKSVYFLHWREEGAQLTLLARDFSSLPITAVDFLIDGSALGLLATDTAKNLQVFAYSKSIETHMGQKLLLKASFHTGEVLSKVLRLPLPPPLATTAAGGGGGQQRNPAAAASGRTNRFGVLAGTLGGAIAVVTPVLELVFRRLDTVQRYMVTAVEQAAGLHPLAFRAVQGLGKGQQHSGVERMIDSQLLAQYALMDDSQQQQLAEDIGSTRPMVLQNLRDLAHNAMLF